MCTFHSSKVIDRASLVVQMIKTAWNVRDLKFWARKILWKRIWQPTPAILPGEFHGQRSLAGYGP